MLYIFDLSPLPNSLTTPSPIPCVPPVTIVTFPWYLRLDEAMASVVREVASEPYKNSCLQIVSDTYTYSCCRLHSYTNTVRTLVLNFSTSSLLGLLHWLPDNFLEETGIQ